MARTKPLTPAPRDKHFCVSISDPETSELSIRPLPRQKELPVRRRLPESGIVLKLKLGLTRPAASLMRGSAPEN